MSKKSSKATTETTPRRCAPVSLFGDGTDVREIGAGIKLCSMKPEYRDCLDRAMDEWKKHKQNLPKKLGGKRYVPGVYGFAYWLIRWSGLVQPVKSPNIGLSVKNDA